MIIGKTRQEPAAEVVEVHDPDVGKARGILRRPLPAGKMRHSRKSPSAEFAPWIAHYWMINWDLRGCEPHVAESLPHPNVHLVFENGDSVIAGVQTRKFTRLLEGQSQVFGVKFRPGGFRPFLGSPVSKLANRLIPAADIFGENVSALKAVVLTSGDDDEKVGAADAFFRARVPEPDKTSDLAVQLVECILQEPAIKAVGDLVSSSGISKRTLQRVFSEYVGVSPKWVIRRYRLHELVEKLHTGEQLNWSQLAQEMGYFDQAHLINDFRSLVGYSPTQYLKQISEKPPAPR